MSVFELPKFFSIIFEKFFTGTPVAGFPGSAWSKVGKSGLGVEVDGAELHIKIFFPLKNSFLAIPDDF